MMDILGGRRPQGPMSGPMPMPGKVRPRPIAAMRETTVMIPKKRAAVGDVADPNADPNATPDDGDMGSGKLSPDKALVSKAEENCGNCMNWEGDSNSCSKVDGTYSEDDRCYSAFSAKSGGDEMDTGGGGDTGSEMGVGGQDYGV